MQVHAGHYIEIPGRRQVRGSSILLRACPRQANFPDTLAEAWDMRRNRTCGLVTALILTGCAAVDAPGTEPDLTSGASDTAASASTGPATGAGGATSTSGAGGSIQFGDSGVDSGSDNCSKVIKAVIRDFKAAQSPGGHPDF